MHESFANKEGNWMRDLQKGGGRLDEGFAKRGWRLDERFAKEARVIKL